MALTWLSCAVLCCSLASLSWTFNLPTRQSTTSKEELVSFLMQEYERSRSKDVIPEPTEGLPLSVTVDIAPIRIVSVENNILTLLVYEMSQWTDPRLAWKESLYGLGSGVEKVTLPADVLWKPDIEYYNGVTKPELLLQQTNVVLYDSGNVTLVPYKKVTSPCHETGASTYTCTIKVGSWAHSAQTLDLAPSTDSIDLLSFQPTEWTIVGASVQRHVTQYECCPEQYIDVTFIYKIQPAY